MQEEWLEMLTHPSISRRACIVRRMAPVKVKGMATARCAPAPPSFQAPVRCARAPLSILFPRPPLAPHRTRAHERSSSSPPPKPHPDSASSTPSLAARAGQVGRDVIGGRDGEEQGRHGRHHHRQPGGGDQARTRGGQGSRSPDSHHLQVARRRRGVSLSPLHSVRLSPPLILCLALSSPSSSLAWICFHVLLVIQLVYVRVSLIGIVWLVVYGIGSFRVAWQLARGVRAWFRSTLFLIVSCGPRDLAIWVGFAPVFKPCTEPLKSRFVDCSLGFIRCETTRETHCPWAILLH